MDSAQCYHLLKTAHQPGMLVCDACAHHCRLSPGQRGRCRVRENQGGRLVSLVAEKLVTEQVDPIEKKPLFHFLPQSRSYSIATVGCNFHCRHCQNYTLSQQPVHREDSIPGVVRSASEVVSGALGTGCQSISYTYVEPTIFLERVLSVAQLAKTQGLKNVLVTNGYFSEQAAGLLVPLFAGMNIDLKSFRDRFYREVCGARLAPVLDNIRRIHASGIWLEVTTLLIPGYNDSEQELEELAAFLVAISPEIPWHVTGFHPCYRLTEARPTSTETLLRAREIGLTAGLAYVYSGNRPGLGQSESTYCAQCGEVVIQRQGYQVVKNGLLAGHCQHCDYLVAGVWA